MMNRKRTHNAGKLKYLLALPVTVLIVMACNNTARQTDTNPEPNDSTDTTSLHTVLSNDTVKVIAPIGTDTTQTQIPPSDNLIYNMVEESPQYPGGKVAMMQFIKESMKYPEEARKKGFQGRVYVQFVIDAKGNVGETKIVRGVDPLLDAEAIRIITSMPQWKPGKMGGKEVSSWYTVPITFKLD